MNITDVGLRGQIWGTNSAALSFIGTNVHHTAAEMFFEYAKFRKQNGLSEQSFLKFNSLE